MLDVLANSELCACSALEHVVCNTTELPAMLSDVSWATAGLACTSADAELLAVLVFTSSVAELSKITDSLDGARAGTSWLEFASMALVSSCLLSSASSVHSRVALQASAEGLTGTAPPDGAGLAWPSEHALKLLPLEQLPSELLLLPSELLLLL